MADPKVRPGSRNRRVPVNIDHSAAEADTPGMDASLIENLINENKPFQIETAFGRIFHVPHRDFINLTPRKTSAFVFYEENGEEHFAIVTLLTITSVMAKS